MFSDRAEGYHRERWHIRYARRLVSLASVEADACVLDADTGTGFAAEAAAEAGASVISVDISPAMPARARAPDVTFVQGDATDFVAYRNGVFDLVLCSAGMLYLPAGNALREWHRVLAPGGRSASPRCGWVIRSPFRRHAADFGLALTDPASPLGTPDHCASALVEAGFVVERVVGETIRSGREDLQRAWAAHIGQKAVDELAGALGRYAS